MALTHQDFELTDEQLAAINRYFEAKSQAVAQSGDHILCPTLHVRFSFATVFGRSVHISYDSEVGDHEIACEWTDST